MTARILLSGAEWHETRLEGRGVENTVLWYRSFWLNKEESFLQKDIAGFRFYKDFSTCLACQQHIRAGGAPDVVKHRGQRG